MKYKSGLISNSSSCSFLISVHSHDSKIIDRVEEDALEDCESHMYGIRSIREALTENCHFSCTETDACIFKNINSITDELVIMAKLCPCDFDRVLFDNLKNSKGDNIYSISISNHSQEVFDLLHEEANTGLITIIRDYT